MSYDLLVDPAQREREAEAKRQKDTLESELKTVESKLPEKYRGKSIEEIAKIAEDIEKEKSRLGNELGQTRKQYADLLERQVKEPPKKEEPPKQITADEVLTNPGDAIEQVIKQSPTVRKALETSRRAAANHEYERFAATYPDFKKDIENPEFIEWVQKSPLRQNLAANADKLDFESATALWGLWDERKEILKEASALKEAQAKAEREKKLKDGELESGTGGGTDSKKIFSRREIIDLKARAKAGDMKAQSTIESSKWQREVQQAYAEGRVK